MLARDVKHGWIIMQTEKGTTTKSRQPRQTIRSFDCRQCGTIEALKVLPYYGRHDIVVCQQCGAPYKILSRRPLIMKPVEHEYGDH